MITDVPQRNTPRVAMVSSLACVFPVRWVLLVSERFLATDMTGRESFDVFYRDVFFCIERERGGN